jgi:hypothetical protein
MKASKAIPFDERTQPVVKILSTVKRIAFESLSGELLGEIVRVNGNENGAVLIGTTARDRAHWQTIEYFGARASDRSLVTPK